MSRTLGSRLRRLRDEAGLSLSELARRSGIGKGTISELENDRRGTRLDTLLALATALEAPLGSLLADETPDRAGPVSGASVTAVLLDRWARADELVEVYRATLSTERQDSAPHAAGVRESVLVVDGSVVAGNGGSERRLQAGESLRYRGDLPHCFFAIDKPADVILLMHYPNTHDGRPRRSTRTTCPQPPESFGGA